MPIVHGIVTTWKKLARKMASEPSRSPSMLNGRPTKADAVKGPTICHIRVGNSTSDADMLGKGSPLLFAPVLSPRQIMPLAD
jgi:hypothetical protein